MQIKLLSQPSLQKLIAADPGQRDYSTTKYYTSLFKFLYLKRIKLGLKLLGDKQYDQMLDLGFGGGIIAPELSKHCQKYFGVDVHQNIALVKEILNDDGLRNIDLRFAKDDLPFADNSFDCIWCMSVLEFVPNPEKSISEIKRVASSDATIILGFPIENQLTNLAYRLIGFKVDEAHKNNHHQLLSLIKQQFKVEQTKTIPGMFMVLSLIKTK